MKVIFVENENQKEEWAQCPCPFESDSLIKAFSLRLGLLKQCHCQLASSINLKFEAKRIKSQNQELIFVKGE